MILILGGMAQGKSAFVQAHFPLWYPQLWEKTRTIPAWVEGEQADWEGILRGMLCRNFQEWIRRMGPESRMSPEEMAERLYQACPERILVMNQVGCGIVPMSREEREYRELAGRVSCSLAARSSQVWRVCCGLGQRMK